MGGDVSGGSDRMVLPANASAARRSTGLTPGIVRALPIPRRRG
jgi:hypothetical protein